MIDGDYSNHKGYRCQLEPQALSWEHLNLPCWTRKVCAPIPFCYSTLSFMWSCFMEKPLLHGENRVIMNKKNMRPFAAFWKHPSPMHKSLWILASPFLGILFVINTNQKHASSWQNSILVKRTIPIWMVQESVLKSTRMMYRCVSLWNIVSIPQENYGIFVGFTESCHNGDIHSHF